MKTLNNAICIKLLSIITIIMLFQSCSKDPKGGCYTPKDNYYYLSAAQLNQTPYFTNKAFDTINYASDKGDTLTFVKTKTDTTWYKEQGNIGSPDCGYDNNFYQTIHNTYSTIKGIGSFDVKQFVKNELGYDGCRISFKNNDYNVAASIIGLKTTKGYREKLVFNNKEYNDVLKIDSTSFNSNIYINKMIGLFRLEYFDDNINWTNYEK